MRGDGQPSPFYFGVIMFFHERTVKRFSPSEAFQDLESLFSSIDYLIQVSYRIRVVESISLELSKGEVFEAEMERRDDILRIIIQHGLSAEDLNEWISVKMAVLNLQDGKAAES
jgi:hypothetical protein